MGIYNYVVGPCHHGMARPQDGSPGGGMWVCGLDWAGPG